MYDVKLPYSQGNTHWGCFGATCCVIVIDFEIIAISCSLKKPQRHDKEKKSVNNVKLLFTQKSVTQWPARFPEFNESSESRLYHFKSKLILLSDFQ